MPWDREQSKCSESANALLRSCLGCGQKLVICDEIGVEVDRQRLEKPVITRPRRDSDLIWWNNDKLVAVNKEGSCLTDDEVRRLADP